MTVATQTRKVEYEDVGATSFAVPFRVLDADHLRVTRTGAGGDQTVLVRETDYTVAGVGLPAGSVELTVALGEGEALLIERDAPFTQVRSLRSQAKFSPAVQEAALDHLTMLVQQVRDALYDEAAARAAGIVQVEEALAVEASLRAAIAAANLLGYLATPALRSAYYAALGIHVGPNPPPVARTYDQFLADGSGPWMWFDTSSPGIALAVPTAEMILRARAPTLVLALPPFDTFDRADGDPGVNWGSITGAGKPPIVNQQLSGGGMARWVSQWARPNNQYVQCEVTSAVQAVLHGPGLRYSIAGANSGYWLATKKAAAGTRDFVLYRWNAGTPSLLKTVAGVATTDNFVRLEASGITLTVKRSANGVDWTVVTTHDDATYAGGDVALRIDGAGPWIDNYKGGAL